MLQTALAMIRPLSIREWRDEYLHFASTRLAKNTVCKKNFAFDQFAKSFSVGDSVRQITPKAVLKWLEAHAKERTPGSANEVRKHLHRAWTWGIPILGLPDKNPFAVPKFPTDKKPRYVPPFEHFQAVLQLATGKDRVLLLCALHTAARRGELFRLRWDDIDFERGLVQLGTRKRRSSGLEFDWLPLTSELSRSLLELRKTSTDGLVFPRPDGLPYRSRSNLFRTLCAQAGVRRFGFHGIRHLSASLMDTGGLSLEDIQSVLRHTSPLTTSGYLHALRGIRVRLDSIFCSLPTGTVADEGSNQHMVEVSRRVGAAPGVLPASPYPSQGRFRAWRRPAGSNRAPCRLRAARRYPTASMYRHLGFVRPPR